MRSINKSVTINQETVTAINIVRQQIVMINENKNNKIIEVVVESYDIEGHLADSQFIKISSDMYDLLMSESPDFAPGKPIDEYRESDLWYIIDMILKKGDIMNHFSDLPRYFY